MLFGFIPYELILVLVSIVMWRMGVFILRMMLQAPESMQTTDHIVAMRNVVRLISSIGFIAAGFGGAIAYASASSGLIELLWAATAIVAAAVAAAMNATTVFKIRSTGP